MIRISSWLLRSVLGRLDAQDATLQQLAKGLANIMAAIDDLKAQVERTTSLEGSAITLIQGIAQQLRDASASGDNAAIATLTTQLSTQADALAAAIAANTPAASTAGTDTTAQPAA